MKILIIDIINTENYIVVQFLHFCHTTIKKINYEE